MTPTSFELVAHIVEILVFLGVGVRGLRKLDRFYGLFADNPPHRHINGKIVYPKGYEPPPVESIDGRGAS